MQWEAEEEKKAVLGDIDEQLRNASKKHKDLQLRMAEAYKQKEARVYDYDENVHR
jgi:hypothetical protein